MVAEEKSLSGTIVAKIIEFNNCGVDSMMTKEPGVAWHLFKGAVELKILSQLFETSSYAELVRANSFVFIAEALVRQSKTLGVPPSPTTMMIPPPTCVVEPTCLSAAKAIEERQVEEAVRAFGGGGHNNSGPAVLGLTPVPPADPTFWPKVSTEPDPAHHHHRGAALLPVYKASIIARSCKLELPSPVVKDDSGGDGRGSSGSDSPVGTHAVSSGWLVYNLALTEHLFNPVNGQPLVLYHLAASMLDQAKHADVLLYNIILNNTGAYYWENNLVDAAQSTMRHLRTLLLSAAAVALVDDDPPSPVHHTTINDYEILETMRRNIQNILAAPRLMISPAA